MNEINNDIALEALDETPVLAPVDGIVVIDRAVEAGEVIGYVQVEEEA